MLIGCVYARRVVLIGLFLCPNSGADGLCVCPNSGADWFVFMSKQWC